MSEFNTEQNAETSLNPSPHAPQTPKKKRGMSPLAVVLLLSGAFFAVFLVISAVLFLGGSSRMGVSAPGGFFGGGVIGVVEVSGVIMDSKDALEQLKKFAESESVKAVVVRIDSPGGAVAPSQEIYQAIRDYKKPIVASMASVAASGGYYIAVAANKVFANPGTITGSIGVIMQFANLQKLYEWAKIERYAVKTGKFKDIGSEYRAIGPDEKQLLQDMVNNVLAQFKTAVAEGRRLRMVEVNAVADGRIMTGDQAKQLKLVDELGGLREAVREAASMAKLKGEPRVVYPEKEKPRLLDFILEGTEGDFSGQKGLFSFLSTLATGALGSNPKSPLSSISMTPGIYWVWEGALR